MSISSHTRCSAFVARAASSREFDAPDAAGARESFIHIHLSPIADDACGELVHALEVVLGEVRLAVQDWRPMRDRVTAIVAELKTTPPPLPVDEIAEAIQFLQWLLADNFTLLGVRDYKVDGQALNPDFESALGVMRSRELRVLRRGDELLEFTPEIMAFLKEPRLLIISKANVHARVHRRVYLDYVGVKRFDSSGNLIGEHRIIGLFTSTAYTRTAHSIPYLRRKIAAVEARAGYDPASHSGKALANVLEHYPRDELFQVDEDTLYNFGLAILQLDERPRVRVLARRDRFDRFVSVLVYVPRERYDSHVRAKIGAYLARVFIGRVSAFYPFFREEGSLVRVHFIIGRSGGATPVVERATLEQEVQSIIRTWSDGLMTRWRWSIRRTKCASCLVVTGTLSRRAFTKPTHPRLPPATFVSSKVCRKSVRLASIFTTGWRKISAASG